MRRLRAARLLTAMFSIVATVATLCAPARAHDELRVDLPDAAATIRDGWFLEIAVDAGRPRRVQVDTGSVGLAIAAAAIPRTAKKLASGSIAYNSSGKIFSGDVYLVTITYPALGGATTIALPVLGVRHVSCDLATHPNCVVAPDEAARVGILGVGFGRHGSGADLADVVHAREAAVNPFLQLSAMAAGTLRRSYAIAPGRIVLGAGARGAEWQSFALTHADRDDWNPLPGCIVAGSYAPSCAGGTALVDTGVGTAIVSVPKRASGPIAAGTPLRLTLGNAPGAAFAFTSTGATCADVALSCARWSHRRSLPIAINTSRRLIAAAEYLFDDESGTVSLRKRSPAP